MVNNKMSDDIVASFDSRQLFYERVHEEIKYFNESMRRGSYESALCALENWYGNLSFWILTETKLETQKLEYEKLHLEVLELIQKSNIQRPGAKDQSLNMRSKLHKIRIVLMYVLGKKKMLIPETTQQNINNVWDVE